MKTFRRILSFVLVLVMISGMMDLRASAIEWNSTELIIKVITMREIVYSTDDNDDIIKLSPWNEVKIIGKSEKVIDRDRVMIPTSRSTEFFDFDLVFYLNHDTEFWEIYDVEYKIMTDVIHVDILHTTSKRGYYDFSEAKVFSDLKSLAPLNRTGDDMVTVHLDREIMDSIPTHRDPDVYYSSYIEFISHARFLGRRVTVNGGTVTGTDTLPSNVARKNLYALGGSTVTLTPDPAPDGYIFSHWKIVKGSGTFKNNDSKSNEFTVGDGNVTLQSVYKKNRFNINVENGTAYKANSTTEITKADTDSRVTIVADAAPENMVFWKWVSSDADTAYALTASDKTSPSITFTMPRSDIRVEAMYQGKPVTVTAENANRISASSATTYGSIHKFEADPAKYPPDRYYLKGWEVRNTKTGADMSECIYTRDDGSGQIEVKLPATDITVSALYEKINYTVTLDPASVCAATPKYPNEGDTVTIQYDDVNLGRAGRCFDRWEIVDTETGYVSDFTIKDPTHSTTTFVMPKGNVKIRGITRDINESDHTVTVIDGLASTGAAKKGDTVNIHFSDLFVDEGQEFSNWDVITDGGFSSVTLKDPGSPDTSFVMPDGNVKIAAKTKDKEYTVTVTNGRITKKNGGSVSGTDTREIRMSKDETIELQADISAGGDTIIWNVEYENMSNPASQESNSFKLKYARNAVLTAVPARSVTVDNGRTNKQSQIEGGTVTIWPDSKSGYSFSYWSGSDSDLLDIYEAEQTFTMPDHSVRFTANYDPNYYEVITNNGTFSSDQMNDANCVPTNGTVTVSAEPPEGYVFDHWEILTGEDSDGQACKTGITLADPKSATTTFTMPAGPVHLEAVNKSVITADMVIVSDDPITYDGTEKEPSVTVAADSVILKKGTDYEIDDSSTYAATKAGKYSITVRGIGDGFTGSVTKEWEIIPREVAVIWNGPFEFPYDGNEHCPDANIGNKVPHDIVDLLIEGGESELGNNHNATVYGLTGIDSGNYVLPADAQNHSFKIIKADSIWKDPGKVSATYGQTLEDVILPEKYAWVDKTLSVGDVTAEGREFSAVYTPDSNHNPVKGNVTVVVTEAVGTWVAPKELEATYGQTLEEVILPANYAWEDKTLSVGDVTAEGHKFTAVYKQDSNHKEVSGDVTVIVKEADGTWKETGPLTATYGQTLEEVKLPANYAWEDKTLSVGDVTDEGHKFTALYKQDSNHKEVSGDVTVIVKEADGSWKETGPLTATYGQTLEDVKLPANYAWEDKTLSVGDVTDEGHKFTALYKQDSNHKEVSGDVTVIVKEADGSWKKTGPLTATYGQTLADVKLPAGYVWKDPSLSVGDTSSNGRGFTAVYTQDENHKPVEGEVTVIVEPADGTWGKTGPLTATYGQTLADVKLPAGYVWKDPSLSVGDTSSNGRGFTAVYTQDENHKPVEGEVTVIVEPADGTWGKTGPLTATYGQTLEDVKLPAGYTWKDKTLSVGDATAKGRGFTAVYKPDNNHNAVEGDITVTVEQADGTWVSPGTLQATYGQTLANVKLPDKYEWKDPSLSVGDATAEGRGFTAVYTEDDNHKAVEGEVTVTVSAANGEWADPGSFSAVFGQTLADIKLPANYSWKDKTQSVGDATQKGRGFTAVYTPDANHDPIEGEVTVTVAPADGTWRDPGKVSAVYGQTLAEIILPEGYEWEDPSVTVGDVTAEGRGFAAVYTQDANHSAAKGEITVTVFSAEGTWVDPGTLTAICGQTLTDIKLPEKYGWKDPTAPVGDATEKGRVFRAIYTPDENHSPVEGDVTVTVGAADGTWIDPGILYATYGQTLANLRLPAKYTWKDPSQQVGDSTAAGRTFTAIYTADDNHTPAEGEVTVIVSAADGNWTDPGAVYANYGQILASIPLPDNYSWKDPTQSVGAVSSEGQTFRAVYGGDANHRSAEGDVTVVVYPSRSTWADPGTLYANYGQTLADIRLPDNYSWKDPSESVGDVTSEGRAFAAVFNADENHKPVEGEITVIVNANEGSWADPGKFTATYGQTLADIKLPDGYAWMDPSQPVGDATEEGRTFAAVYTQDACHKPAEGSITVIVNAAEGSWEAPEMLSGISCVYGQTLADIELPENYRWKDPSQSVGDITGEGRRFSVIYTPDANHTPVEGEVSVTVYPVDYDVSVLYGSKWIKNSELGLIFRGSGEFSDFLGLEIDDSSVPGEWYTASEGSTVVEVKPGYLQDMSTGEHSVRMLWKGGTASFTFSVDDAPVSSPDTGDSAASGMTSCMLAFSLAGIAIMMLRKRGR